VSFNGIPKPATMVHVEPLTLTRIGNEVRAIDRLQGYLHVFPSWDARSTVVLGTNCLSEQLRQFYASRA
jgi:hypothetical protein